MYNNDDIIKNLDSIVNGYENAKDLGGQLLCEKYTQTFVYTLVQKHLFDLEAIFNLQHKHVIDVFDFITSLLKFTSHQIEETIFVIVQFVDFFKAVCEEIQSNQIKFSDLSTYMCKYNPNLDEIDVPLQTRFIATHQYPPKKQFNKPQHRKVRSIDLNAPVVLGASGYQTKRLNKEKIFIDSQKNSNSSITKVQYQEKLMKILVLHQYSEQISIYKPDCSLSFVLKPKAPQLRNIIHDFCWSEQQQRLGLVLKDAFICFYDGEEYEFEKFFSSKQEQKMIFFVQNKWISVSFDMRVSIWNLELEDNYCFNHEALKNIITIVEVPYLQQVCIACSDKLTLWDTWEKNPKLLFKLQVNHARLNSLMFFDTYHVLVTAGFDNKINIYQLHKKYNDGDFVGQLEGHASIITAIQCVEKSPIIISSDDKHIVKLWDIRIMKCIQSFDLELRQTIGAIIVLQNVQAVCLATCRLMVMNFEGHNQRNMKNPKPLRHHDKQIYATGIVLDSIKNRFIISTKRDVRFINIFNGQTIQILKVMIGQADDEICRFQPLQQHKKLIIGTSKGFLKIYETHEGEQLNEVQIHNNRITNMQIDYQNHLVVTSSLDGKLITFREQNMKFEPIRTAENIHSGVDYCHYSQAHNIILTGGVDQVGIWNFEFGKLITVIKHVKPKGLYVMDYNGMIILGEKDCTYIIGFDHCDESIQLKEFYRIDDILIKFVHKAHYLLGSNKNGDLTLVSVPIPSRSSIAYNPYRLNWEDYNISSTSAKITNYLLDKKSEYLKLTQRVKAHKDKLTHLDIVSIEGENLLVEGNQKLLTASKDGKIKLFSFPQLQQLCSLNINHPLPVQWDLELDTHEITKFKLAFALKIITFLRSQPNQSVSQARMLDPRTLLKYLMQVQGSKNRKTASVELLDQEYEKRDLIFNKVKDLYTRELQGQSLQQIEERKKAHMYAQMWKVQEEVQDEVANKQLDDAKQKDFKFMQNFLNPNFRNKKFLNEIEQIEHQEMMDKLSKKLDKAITREDEVNMKATIGRRQSKLNNVNVNRSTNSNTNKLSRLRQTDQTVFFQYATEKKLASTNISQRSTEYQMSRTNSRAPNTDRPNYNVGSLISDLVIKIFQTQQIKKDDDSRKRANNSIGDIAMRKTSNQIFHKIVQNLDQKLRDSKYKKWFIPPQSDRKGEIIDANLERMFFRLKGKK